MKTVTELTKEELALVQASREKVEQDKIDKQKLINKKVENQKQVAMKAMLEGEKQVKATYDYFKYFKSGEFELVGYPLKREMEVKDYTTGDYYFRENYIINNVYIQHKETKIKILVERHTVYSNKGYGSSYKGYKMFCHSLEGNRAYSKVSTIEEKLLNFINIKRAIQTSDEIRESFITELIETQPIPNAKIRETYIHSNYVSNRRGIEIKYENNSIVICSINITEVGEVLLSVFSTEFPKPKIEGETVMDRLRFISKLEF